MYYEYMSQAVSRILIKHSISQDFSPFWHIATRFFFLDVLHKYSGNSIIERSDITKYLI